MRKVLFILAIILTSMVTYAQQMVAPTTESLSAPPSKAVLTFVTSGGTDADCDYGTIEYNADPKRTVKFKNTGIEPLIITGARGSCGCTVPTYSKDPILPGQEGTIDITYQTTRVGAIDKRVTVTTNEGKEHYIRVIGNVKPQPAANQTAPAVPEAAPSIIKSGGGK
jgi:hypothetical protein